MDLASLDVLVVGYGPVGQLLALQLGQAGLNVAVVERFDKLYHAPRAVHYDDEVARMFQGAGVGDAIQAISHSLPSNTVFRYTGCEGQTLMQLVFGGDGQSAWPMTNGFAQPELETILDAAVRKLPNVQVMQSWEAVDLQQSEGGVDLTVRRRLDSDEVAAGTVRQLHAKYVVGTDGANSFVRSRMNVSVTDLGFSFDWLVVNVKYRSLDTPHVGMVQACDPKRIVTVTPSGRGRQRFEFMLAPGESAADMGSPEVTWQLLAGWGLNPGNVELERHAVYTFNARWANTWRDNRVLLAGDAAHVMPPFRAQGMCSGMRDATSLAWRLPLVLAGKAPTALLDSYYTERIPHVRNFIEQTIEAGRMICISDPVAARQRDAMMLAAMADPARRPPPPPELRLGPGVLQDGNAHGGRLSFQGFVEHQGQRGRFDDVVGRGWQLIGTSIDPAQHLDVENRRFLDSLGATIAHVTPEGPIRDVDGAYAAWFERKGYGAVLVRPDFYQVGATSDPAQIDDLVRTVRAQLQPADQPPAAPVQPTSITSQ